MYVPVVTVLECVSVIDCTVTTLWYVAGRPVKMQSVDGIENVEQRQKKINATYSELLDLAQVSC
jgi:hypothetical protein